MSCLARWLSYQPRYLLSLTRGREARNDKSQVCRPRAKLKKRSRQCIRMPAAKFSALWPRTTRLSQFAIWPRLPIAMSKNARIPVDGEKRDQVWPQHNVNCRNFTRRQIKQQLSVGKKFVPLKELLALVAEFINRETICDALKLRKAPGYNSDH